MSGWLGSSPTAIGSARRCASGRRQRSVISQSNCSRGHGFGSCRRSPQPTSGRIPTRPGHTWRAPPKTVTSPLTSFVLWVASRQQGISGEQSRVPMDTVRRLALHRHFYTTELRLADYGQVLLIGDREAVEHLLAVVQE